MTWLVTIGLTNAVLASLLAGVAWLVGHRCRRPALARLIWIVVLLKLVTPPLAKVSVGDWFSTPTGWLSEITAVDDSTNAGGPLAFPTSTSDELTSVAPQAVAGDDRVTAFPAAATQTRALVDREVPAITPQKSRSRPRFWSALSPLVSLRFAAAVWASGSAACLAWLALRAWRFRKFLARVGRHDDELSDRVALLARRAGLASAPRVLVVESAVSPMLWGAGRGAWLLFPGVLARRMDQSARDALLLHELAHYARGDWLVRVLELAAQVAYWWHPLVWWVRRQIEAAEEECCDAWVVEHQTGPRRLYAEALLATIDFLCETARPLPPAACGLGEVSLLRSRLTQIMCGEVAMHPSRAAKMLVMGMAAMVLPLGPSFIGAPSSQASARSTPPIEASTTSLLPSGSLEEAIVTATEVADNEVELRQTNVRPASRSPFPVRTGPVLYATATSPNGKYKLEARTGYKTTLINVDSDEPLDLSYHRIRCASFSPDSRFIVTGHDDGKVRVWDCNGGQQKSLAGCEAATTSVEFSPDGERVAAGDADGNVIVWKVNEATAYEMARLPREETPVSCLRWSKHTDRLAIAYGDWSNGDFSSLVIWRPTDPAADREYPFGQSTAAFDWLAEDELVAVEWNGKARVLSLTTGTSVEILSFGKDLVSAAAWSPDCSLVPRWQASQVSMENGR